MHPLATQLLDWYKDHQRDLPWRHTNDPYRIWLSEIILQQTRVNQGLPYYQAFVEKFPGVDALAAAPEDSILRTWQGLGYYSRARNLHKCARQVVEKHDARFPDNYDDLKSLPGIGPYTAAAVASIAFREAVPVIDGNVFRVVTRHFGLKNDISKPSTRNEIEKILKNIIPEKHPGEFNQALMELGAMTCSPRNPACDECPLAASCHARKSSSQHLFPVKSKKGKVKKRYFNYLIYEKNGRILMKKRTEKDIWHGLYDFPLIETGKRNDDSFIPGYVEESKGPYRHLLSHQEINASFHRMSGEPETMDSHHWYDQDEVESLPKPILIDRYLNDHGF